MLSMVKLLLKGEVGVCALNSHGNYIVDHGKSWNCFWIFVETLIFCGYSKHGLCLLNGLNTIINLTI